MLISSSSNTSDSFLSSRNSNKILFLLDTLYKALLLYYKKYTAIATTIAPINALTIIPTIVPRRSLTGFPLLLLSSSIVMTA